MRGLVQKLTVILLCTMLLCKCCNQKLYNNHNLIVALHCTLVGRIYHSSGTSYVLYFQSKYLHYCCTKKKFAREFSQRKIICFLKIIVSFIFSPNRLFEQQGAENSGIVIFRMISRKVKQKRWVRYSGDSPSTNYHLFRLRPHHLA
jgi:hypothetical protein